MQFTGINPLEHGAEQKKVGKIPNGQTENSQHTQAPHLQRGAGKCNSLVCPEGEKWKHLVNSQSDNHNRFTDWGNFLDCLETSAETTGIMWVGGYYYRILLNQTPYISQHIIHSSKMPCEVGFPFLHGLVPWLPWKQDNLTIWVSLRGGDKKGAFLYLSHLYNALKFNKLIYKYCLILYLKWSHEVLLLSFIYWKCLWETWNAHRDRVS